ncbi:ATPase [Thiohalobacter thiocyanaticus]|uniref:ATPase n=1 Tax=Thiohalobacter thiocyanaticus TaxID=585455 RepID=A0A1Z4VRU3_9GAMM|nr:ATPase [Thiohalobacter thiocyanaticus]
MSWRETLGVPASTETLYTHNSQNAQNPTEQGNCADSADSAYRDSEQENSKLLEALADACNGLDITPPR